MTSATGLLDRAVSYAVSAVSDVTPALLPRPTPCQGWNLEMLLRHACESLAALHSGIVAGSVGLIPVPPDPALAAEPARVFRERARQLHTALALLGSRHRAVDVAGRPLAAIVMECAGALEVAVHGWDISQACGQRTPLPDTLATDLLAIAPLLVPETGRHPLFKPPVTATAQADPGDRLVAFLGRKLEHRCALTQVWLTSLPTTSHSADCPDNS
jgi:uncharacterized protein (TIGR03086 family)